MDSIVDMNAAKSDATMIPATPFGTKAIMRG